MEVIPLIRSSATGSETSKNDNGIKRHVQEWSRLDRLTGILEHARVEADQWTNHTANSKHKYGKVVDRRARNLADGTKEETQQTKQLEVFQAHTAGCSVQVIRSQTSTTSSWHNSSVGSGAFKWPSSIFDKKDNHFDQLRLEHSPLDVSSQKNKASVGRSGSISARRPPTRRPQAAAIATSRLPKIESVDSADTADASSTDGSLPRRESAADESISTNLNRVKSCSTDEIRGDADESDETLDRSSRFRRSLQFSQSGRHAVEPADRSRGVTGELESVLKKVLGKKLLAVNGGGDVSAAAAVDDDRGSLQIKPASAPKKPSIVTVESLKKTKSGLRHLQEQNCNGGGEDDDDDREDSNRDDDGIETDAKQLVGDSRSLDYRGSALTSSCKTEEWYNRRKSYGFERVAAADRPGEYAAAAEPSSAQAIDSSTDSGICRSTENGLSNSSRQSSVDRESIADLVRKYSAKEINNNTQAALHAYNTTVVAKGRILEAINSLRSKSSAYFDVVKPNDAAVIPASKEHQETGPQEQVQQYTRRLSVGVDVTAVEKNNDRDEVPKRHSIAVVSEVADRDPNVDKKNGNKKVEFCRTEVHFDATPGKINIVDMEDKPAPAQLYRPKKRYNRPPEKNHGLPEYRFGDDVHYCSAAADAVSQRTVDGNDDEERGATPAAAAEDDAAADGNNCCSGRPKSILKRQQQQQQQQQQNADGSGGGMASDNGIEVRISSTESTPVDCRRASWSVADRIKQVEAVGFSTRVNFTEGETTAVGFDPTDPKKYRYSYNGTASPVWYQNNPSATDASAAAAKCHEKLLVRIGTTCCNGGAVKTNATAATADLCAFSKCFGSSSASATAEQRLTSTSLVLRTEQPGAYAEETNAKTAHGRFRKTPSTSWPRCGHKTYPAAVRKYCSGAPKSRAADAGEIPDVIGALDDLSKTIDEQIVRDHVTLIEVRQSTATDRVERTVHGRLELVKDLMSTDETSEESLKADEEVRSYMAAVAGEDDDGDDDRRLCEHPHRLVQPPSECENLKKLISTVKKHIKQSQCSQENSSNKSNVKSYESSLQLTVQAPPPNVTSVLLNHEKPSEPERSQFQPVGAHATQVTHVVEHRFDSAPEKKPSKRVPVKIVQDNRKTKPKTEISKTEVQPVAKVCATVSLKQVPMTVQPRPSAAACGDKRRPADKKESMYSNVGYRACGGNVVRAKDKPAAADRTAQQDLFSTGRDSWLNMPKDLGPKLNRCKATSAHGKSRPGRKESSSAATAAAESDVSVLEELNRAADEILKAVNGYTDDESLHPNDGGERKAKSDDGGRSEAKLKNRKKAARLLQRANSREALLHLDETSSSDEDAAAAAAATADDAHRAKPKTQRKPTGKPSAVNGVANKTTASFAKKIQSRAHNASKIANVQHKVHPTYYGNVQSSYMQSAGGPVKLRNKSSESVTKQIVDQKDSKGRYQCKITTRTFGSKKTKCTIEESKNSIKGC